MIKYFYMKFAGDIHMTLKILFIAAFAIHACYLVIFAFMGEEKLAVMNIFSVLIYIFLIAIIFGDERNLKISLAIFQFEVLFHAILCIFVLGFGFGFELVMFALLVNLLFINHSYKKLTYVVIGVTAVSFIILFAQMFERINCDCFWARFLFTYNFIVVAFIFVAITDFLEVSNSFELLKAKMQKNSIQAVANKDPLTGLLNRKSFDDFVSTNLHERLNFAVIIGDIDNFKMINDTYGHNAGDEALVRVAGVFKSVFRKNDFVCRWGGEEFLIIIHNVEPKIAFDTISRAKNLITQTPLNFDGKKIEITLTYGMVMHESGKDVNIAQMIKTADDLLYQGKKSGKNRIVTERNLG